MTNKPAFAPGCFGSAIFFNGDGVCSSCAYAAECKPVHLEAQRQLRQSLGVEVKPKRDADALPVKVQKMFNDLNVSTLEVRTKMQSGENPFTLNAGFMGVVCHAILQRRSIERPALERFLERARGVNAETAYYYVRSAVQILQHCGVVMIDKNTVRLCGVDDK